MSCSLPTAHRFSPCTCSYSYLFDALEKGHPTFKRLPTPSGPCWALAPSGGAMSGASSGGRGAAAPPWQGMAGEKRVMVEYKHLMKQVSCACMGKQGRPALATCPAGRPAAER